MPSPTVLRALVDKQSLLVVNKTNISVTATEWNDGSAVRWVCAIQSGQSCGIGDQYTPAFYPITTDNALSGGTYATPPPQYPPIEESKANAVAAVDLLASQKLITAVGEQDATTAYQTVQRLLELSKKKALADAIIGPQLTADEAAEFAQLSANLSAGNPVIVAQTAILAWISAQTDTALMAGFAAENPTASGAPGWPI